MVVSSDSKQLQIDLGLGFCVFYKHSLWHMANCVVISVKRVLSVLTGKSDGDVFQVLIRQNVVV